MASQQIIRHVLTCAMRVAAGSRSITALARFGYEIGDGKNLVEHYGHRLRYELIEYWKENPLEGSQQGLASVEVQFFSFNPPLTT